MSKPLYNDHYVFEKAVEITKAFAGAEGAKNGGMIAACFEDIFKKMKEIAAANSPRD